MTSRSLVSGILVSAFALAPGPARAQSRVAADMAAADALYSAQRYAEAAAAYEAVLAADPSVGEAHFFLANALDNQYRPSRRGESANDHLLEAARDHYTTASMLLVRPDQAVVLKRTLQYLAAVYSRDKLNQPDEAELVVKQLIAMEPSDIGSYFALVRIYEDAGKFEDAEEILKQAQVAAPDKTDVSSSAQFYNRKGEFDRAMDSFQKITQIEPKNPQNFYQMAVFYEEKVRKDFTIKPAQVADYLNKGMEAVDKALELRPDYFEALTYKNLILRQQARFETDPDAQRLLLEQADALQRQAIDVRNAQVPGPRRP